MNRKRLVYRTRSCCTVFLLTCVYRATEKGADEHVGWIVGSPSTMTGLRAVRVRVKILASQDTSISSGVMFCGILTIAMTLPIRTHTFRWGPMQTWSSGESLIIVLLWTSRLPHLSLRDRRIQWTCVELSHPIIPCSMNPPMALLGVTA